MKKFMLKLSLSLTTALIALPTSLLADRYRFEGEVLSMDTLDLYTNAKMFGAVALTVALAISVWALVSIKKDVK